MASSPWTGPREHRDWRGTGWRVTTRRLPAVLFAIALACPLSAQEVIELPAQDSFMVGAFLPGYRVGSILDGSWDTFGAIGDLAFDAAGNLYIFDAQALRISVVDPSGALIRQFGQRGEGPG